MPHNAKSGSPSIYRHDGVPEPFLETYAVVPTHEWHQTPGDAKSQKKSTSCFSFSPSGTIAKGEKLKHQLLGYKHASFVGTGLCDAFFYHLLNNSLVHSSLNIYNRKVPLRPNETCQQLSTVHIEPLGFGPTPRVFTCLSSFLLRRQNRNYTILQSYSYAPFPRRLQKIASPLFQDGYSELSSLDFCFVWRLLPHQPTDPW